MIHILQMDNKYYNTETLEYYVRFLSPRAVILSSQMFYGTEHTSQHNLRQNTVKPVCKDHLLNKIDYLWFIQLCALMTTGGTNLLLLSMAAFWGSSRWPRAT